MVSLYLHNCYDSSYRSRAIYVFNSLIENIKNLKSSNKDSAYDIIIDKAPSEYKIVDDLSLSDLISNMPQKDSKRFASSLFTKYPIDNFYNIDNIFSEEIPNFFLYEIEALNLYVAFCLNRVALSLPFDRYCTDKLKLINDLGSELEINNFYGSNIDFFKSIYTAPDEAKSFLDKIREINNGNIILSDSFIKDFNSVPMRIQHHIFDAFKAAENAKILVPCVPDNSKIKKFEIKKGQSIYELRSMSEDGFRICIDSVSNMLYVALFYSKAEFNTSNGQKKQSLKAYRIIERLCNPNIG